VVKIGQNLEFRAEEKVLPLFG